MIKRIGCSCRKTCNNVSVVDYLLLSSSFFTHVHDEVGYFNPLNSGWLVGCVLCPIDSEVI